uniref:(northern house mosquito) hypothetical protein n=1 Tax=Culex pipiens TaxID=7175 RepID=A0A8D8HLI8_CULPI
MRRRPVRAILGTVLPGRTSTGLRPRPIPTCTRPERTPADTTRCHRPATYRRRIGCLKMDWPACPARSTTWPRRSSSVRRRAATAPGMPPATTHLTGACPGVRGPPSPRTSPATDQRRNR